MPPLQNSSPSAPNVSKHDNNNLCLILPFTCPTTGQTSVEYLLCASLPRRSSAPHPGRSIHPTRHFPSITFYFLILTCTLPPQCLCPAVPSSTPTHPHSIQPQGQLKGTFSMKHPRFPHVSMSHFSDHLLLPHPQEDLAVPISELLEHHALSASLL